MQFCRHDNPQASALVPLLFSLGAQLCGVVPGLKEQLALRANAIEKAILENKPALLFKALLADPLCSTPAPSASPVVLILDALDELPNSSRRDLLNLLSSELSSLPSYVRLFVTSREQADVERTLKKFDPMLLRVDEIRNLQDINAYLAHTAAKNLSG